MSDHIEHACSKCGSLLHFADQCDGARARSAREQTKEKWRANYVPAPHYYNLNQAVALLNRAFSGYGSYGCYLVGSSLARRDFRDVDVRMILPDDGYERLFGSGTDWTNPLWSLLCTTFSMWLSQQSGLPIDFQIQKQSAANRDHPGAGRRSALGIFLDYPGERPSDVKSPSENR